MSLAQVFSDKYDINEHGAVMNPDVLDYDDILPKECRLLINYAQLQSEEFCMGWRTSFGTMESSSPVSNHFPDETLDIGKQRIMDRLHHYYKGNKVWESCKDRISMITEYRSTPAGQLLERDDEDPLPDDASVDPAEAQILGGEPILNESEIFQAAVLRFIGNTSCHEHITPGDICQFATDTGFARYEEIPSNYLSDIPLRDALSLKLCYAEYNGTGEFTEPQVATPGCTWPA